MALPYFYSPNLLSGNDVMEMDEDNSRHMVQVLRMQEKEQVRLTDGIGNIVLAEILQPHKKKTTVKKLSLEKKEAPASSVSIAISLLKNAPRFEWFLEKAAEIGIRRIVPLICERTEGRQFKKDRWQQILVSAMLQSQQSWLTEITQPAAFAQFVKNSNTAEGSMKWIAHCEDEEKAAVALLPKTSQSSVVLIGPEGDFTPKEIELALQQGFKAVSLGKNRLRTETAGLVAACLLAIH